MGTWIGGVSNMQPRRKGRRGMRLVGLVVALVLSPSAVPWVPGTGCPHHTGTGGHGAHPADARDAVIDAHADTAGEHAARHGGRLAEGHQPDSGPSHAPPPCDCLGECPVPAGPALPATHGLRLESQALVAASSGPSPSSRLPFGRAPYTLPFANGPPLS